MIDLFIFFVFQIITSKQNMNLYYIFMMYVHRIVIKILELFKNI